MSLRAMLESTSCRWRSTIDASPCSPVSAGRDRPADIVSALKINADLERVGDLAVNIGEAAQRYLLHPPVKPLIDLPRMGDLALKMLREALDAFVSRDVSLAQACAEPGRLAGRVEESDLSRAADLHARRSADDRTRVDLILISRHLERVGDHATNIAEDVIFIVEARDVRHRSAVSISSASPGTGTDTLVERRKGSRIPSI